MDTCAEPLDILLATWEGGGNVPPVLGAARRLLARGHRVRVMADAVVGPEAERAGAGFRAWQRAPSRRDRSPASDVLRDWEAADDLGGFLRLRDLIMCGPALAYAEDVLEELGRRRADLILTSEMLLGVMAAGEAAGVPLGLLCPNISVFPLPGVPPLGMGLLPATTEAERARHAEIGAGFRAVLDEGLPPVNAARRALGLPPARSLGDQFRAAKCALLATSPVFDFPADVLPPMFRYVGPLLAEPEWAEGASSPRSEAAPLVVVAFSSTFQDQLGAIRNAARAMAELPVRGVVTLGPALAGAQVDAPPNVAVVDAASHDVLMAGAAAVITHAGHGTVMRSLTHGVPLLCLPMGRDQHDNAARVTARGAGLTLDRAASAAAIREALQRLLQDGAFRAAARRLSAAIVAGTGTVDFVAEAEALAAVRAPLPVPAL
jgi:MGT family glycosyltransferase